jgi:hypothetical protein
MAGRRQGLKRNFQASLIWKGDSLTQRVKGGWVYLFSLLQTQVWLPKRESGLFIYVYRISE